mgnify:CR=1 FL=1
MRKFMQIFFAFKTMVAVLTFFAFWAAIGTGLCGDAKTVAVCPFEMNSSQDLGFLQNGLFSMLSSRLSDAGKVDVLDRETVDKALAKAKAGREAANVRAVSNFHGLAPVGRDLDAANSTTDMLRPTLCQVQLAKEAG